MIIFCHFRLGWIFLLKHVYFCILKMLLKKFEILLFFYLLQIIIFCIILIWRQTQEARHKNIRSVAAATPNDIRSSSATTSN
jgi:sensor domain CHASE-containing protein